MLVSCKCSFHSIRTHDLTDIILWSHTLPLNKKIRGYNVGNTEGIQTNLDSLKIHAASDNNCEFSLHILYSLT